MNISAQDFGASFKGFLEQMSSAAPVEDPFFRRRLKEHFGQDPETFSTVSEKFPTYEHANMHLAVEAELARSDTSHELMGLVSPHSFMGATLSMLSAPARPGLWDNFAPAEGPVQHVNIALDDGRVLACVQSGLYLVRRGEQPLAVLVEGPHRDYHPMAQAKIEVMARARDVAEAFLADIRTAMRKRNVYRGHVLSLDTNEMQQLEIKFHRLPAVRRENIILPAGLLERIERQTVRFSLLSEKLLAARRHLKRGVLLHGPPGTGKTLTAMYIADAIRNRTVLLLTGRGQGLIEQSCALARTLQPSIVILEDVDLVAEERTHRPGCVSPLLFELLNQMDGLADDADVLFLLTTNRPDLLEPALAARPGRVDLAVEIPLPDAECRRRLLELYSQGLNLGEIDHSGLVRKTDGASAAFIREVMRKAALFAADENCDAVTDRHLDEAIHDLVIEGGPLTHSLLGFARPHQPSP